MDETTSHIVLCPSQGRTVLFHNSVSWRGPIQTFLLGRGELTTISLPYDAPPKYELVCQQTCLLLLGFDNFVEGRIPSVLVDFQLDNTLSVATQWTLGI